MNEEENTINETAAKIGKQTTNNKVLLTSKGGRKLRSFSFFFVFEATNYTRKLKMKMKNTREESNVH